MGGHAFDLIDQPLHVPLDVLGLGSETPDMEADDVGRGPGDSDERQFNHRSPRRTVLCERWFGAGLR